MAEQLLDAAKKGDTETVIALLNRGANIEAGNSVSFSFSNSVSVWFAGSSTLTLTLTVPDPDPNPSPDVDGKN